MGDVVPDFAFPEFLAGGDGRQRLSEFRGQPVLIVNWTDTDFGRGASDKVRKLAESAVPDGLVVVLRDTHGKSADEILCSRLRRYPDSPARFIRNMKDRVTYADNGPPPDVALIDMEGRLVLAGSYTVDLGKAEKLIKAELKKRRSGWGEHGAARKTRALLYGKERLGEARALIEGALAAEPSDAELLAVQAEVHADFSRRERTIRYATERGECGRALDEARALRAAVEGAPEWVATADELLATFETPESQRELELDEDLASLLKRMRKKLRESEVEKLRKLAAEAGSDSAVGRRAAELARVAALCLD